MTGFTDVQTILDAQLATVSGIPALTGENERLKTSSTSSWGRTTLAPAETVQECIGVLGTDRLNGLYVIDLFYPKDAGVASGNADVDAITVAFESGTIFTSGANKVEIFNSYPNPSVPDLENFYRKQIIVVWRARRQRTV
jgi:hypothetical protein